jgi:hypothetical protein
MATQCEPVQEAPVLSVTDRVGEAAAESEALGLVGSARAQTDSNAADPPRKDTG